MEFLFQSKPKYQISYANWEGENEVGQLEGLEPLLEDDLRTDLVICTWNVNGLRTRILANCDNKTLNLTNKPVTKLDPSIGLGQLIAEHKVNIFALQETRISDANMMNVQLEDWDIYTSESKGTAERGPNRYSGTSIWIKKGLLPEPTQVITDFPDIKNEGRIIALEFNDFWIVNVYTPNSGTNREFREEIWSKVMYNFLSSIKNVIYLGDMNVARSIYDLSISNKEAYSELNPEVIDSILTSDGRTGFLPGERKWIESLLKEGFVDVWRRFNPNQKHTGYTYNENLSGVSMRIDYFLVKMAKAHKINKCYLGEYVRKSSDHIPLIMEITI